MSGGYPPGTTQADLDRYFEDEADCPEYDCDGEEHCQHRSCCICGAIRR
ncbi:MAG: hypothetical protein HC923_01135 [Myxococcales bacterium]|nr:hypothetical protein [Myxococcales bacterium]